jgi:hypothetical protein
MAAKHPTYKGNMAASTARGPSPAIWADCPWEAMDEDPTLGMKFWDDFTVIGNADMTSAYANSIGQWSSYGYAGAQLNDGQKEGGVIKLSSNGDNEGLTLLSSAGSFRFCSANSTTAPNYSQKMWFETRIAKSVITTAHISVFVGLMAPTLASGLPAAAQPWTTTDDTLMTAGDTFGFNLAGTTSTRGGPTEVGTSFCLASGTINYPTNLTALMAATGQTVLAADTYVKLGWIFDPGALIAPVSSATARQTAGNLRRKLIRFFVNGLEAPAFLTSDDIANATSGQLFPTAFMCPVLSVMNMASQSSDYLAADWVRIAQLANS